jgi:hypothetical protein
MKIKRFAELTEKKKVMATGADKGFNLPGSTYSITEDQLEVLLDEIENLIKKKSPEFISTIIKTYLKKINK